MKFKKFGKLPGKPSALIRIAIRDMVEAKKAGHGIVMSSWVVLGTKKCTVCAAGAVMMNLPGFRRIKKEEENLKKEPAHLFPCVFRRENMALHAIDYLRCGDISTACRYLGCAAPMGFAHWLGQIPQYEDSYKGFYAKMRQFAKELEAVGY